MKQLGLGFLFFIIGASCTVFFYLLSTKQHIRLVSPLPVSHFSLDNPPSSSMTGKITVLTENVVWESRTADNFVPINSPQNIQQGEALQTDKKGSVTFIFDNIATIHMLNNSQVNVIQTLPTDLVIQQIEGKVYYDENSSNSPLSVRALDLLAATNNGKFSLSVDKDNSLVSISVSQGSLKLAYTDTQNTTNLVEITKGENVVFNNNTKILQ